MNAWPKGRGKCPQLLAESKVMKEVGDGPEHGAPLRLPKLKEKLRWKT
jgi:hypothetical protein